MFFWVTVSFDHLLGLDYELKCVQLTLKRSVKRF